MTLGEEESYTSRAGDGLDVSDVFVSVASASSMFVG